MLSHRRALSAAEHRSQSGFTVMELLAAMMILSLLIGPIVAAFVVSAESAESSTAVLRSSNGRQQLASVFASDVASVDSTGANSGGYVCRSSAGWAAGRQPAVNLNSTTLADDGSGPVTRRVTYWAEGSGRQATILRAECAGADPAGDADGAQVRLVARNIGDETTTPASLLAGGLAGGQACDEFKCVLDVDGRFQYEVSAQRRVYGAGVPVEVGHIYASGGVTYELFDTDGASMGEERVWPTEFTLAPGLEGDATLAVQFRVQQVLEDRSWNGSDFVAGEHWVDAEYIDSVWRLPIEIGDFDRGGEYRVWTQLSYASGDDKEYGGVNGFPLWIDWNPSQSVFVSNSSTGSWPGSATNTGITDAAERPHPVATVAQGLARAAEHDRPQVLVVDNAAPYGSLQVTGTATAWPSNRTIVGGLDPATLLRAVADPSTGGGMSDLVGADNVGHNPTAGVTVNRPVTLRMRQLDITSGVPGSNTGGTAYGLRALGGSQLTVERSRIEARPGAVGVAGVAGTGGSRDGCDGPNAERRNDDRNTLPTTDDLANRTYAPCGVSSGPRVSGYGGAGGSPGFFGFGATDGEDGGRGGASPTGPAGGAGTDHGCDPEPGGPGLGAAQSAAGGSGGTAGQTPAPSSGSIANAWQLPANASGTAGGAGSDGWGGGGSGGAGATACIIASAGARGARGGEGGIGGAGGGGGLPGGSSFGVYALQAGTSVVLTDTRVVAGPGGDGGAGGAGGVGGAGGNGGTGTASFFLQLGEDTAGAGGGSGGGGGGGGGGGAGGWSVAVLAANGADASTGGASLQQGAAGLGGAGGTDAARHQLCTVTGPDVQGTCSSNGGPGGGGGAEQAETGFWFIIWWIRTGPGSPPGVNGVAGAGGAPGAPGADGRSCAVYTGGGSCAS